MVTCHQCERLTSARFEDSTYRVHYPTTCTARPCRASWGVVREVAYPFARVDLRELARKQAGYGT